ncbi:isoprenoid synthase domain-containing protein [Fomitopsis serialis]|uniref:isoprenoid synthase domain-containing protein n=1 Tax=Fomitopsis serialis TaxID=139415 RepID=UPI00200808A5|nr:isoprenoid synthase domain-containing protein [Neoantrodia serialis]KAH9926490.1 isoprenoid synthase domain-containing protein [Neoantrodia serialis]
MTVPIIYSRSPSLEARVEAATKSWPFADRIRPYVASGIIIAETCYSHLTGTDAQVAIALYTALMVTLDDRAIFDELGAQEFPRMLCDGSAHRDQGLLGALTRVLVDLGQLFPPFGVGCIVSSTLRWFTGEMSDDPGKRFFLEAQSKSFADYQRFMTGVAEPYASFIWSKEDFPHETSYIHILPEACVYMIHINDILSFYKEELAGETNNYIHARSRATSKLPRDVLCQLIDEVVAAAERVRDHLGEGPVRDAWDNFEAGYIHYHIGNPRYRLQEVLGAGFMIGNRTD